MSVTRSVWRQEHRSHQVRDLVYIDQSSGVFTQVSDLFSHVIVCSQAGCGHVVYTNNLDTARVRLQRHSASLHKTDEGDTQTLSTKKLVSVESLEITGYTCAVDTSSKALHVSKTCSAPVALSKMHKDLDTSKFAFNTQYNKDIETAVNVSIDLARSGAASGSDLNQ